MRELKKRIERLERLAQPSTMDGEIARHPEWHMRYSFLLAAIEAGHSEDEDTAIHDDLSEILRKPLEERAADPRRGLHFWIQMMIFGVVPIPPKIPAALTAVYRDDPQAVWLGHECEACHLPLPIRASGHDSDEEAGEDLRMKQLRLMRKAWPGDHSAHVNDYFTACPLCGGKIIWRFAMPSKVKR